jgi:serine/threonine protein kinase
MDEIKLSDFGCSMKLESKDELIYKKNYGTPSYSSPESIFEEEYCGKMADIWAFGVTIFVMLNGKLPFEGTNLNSIYNSIKNDNVIFERNDLDDDCVDLLKGMLEKDPKKRFKISDIKKHNWIKDHDLLNKYENNKFMSFIHNKKDLTNTSIEKLMEEFKKKVKVSDQRYKLKQYKNVFIGIEVIYH